MRSSRMIGNLWIALGINSRSKSPPASVAIDQERACNYCGGDAGCRIVGNCECRRRATPDPGEVDLAAAVIPTANQRLHSGSQTPMDEASVAYPVIAWILTKGRGEYSVREYSRAGGAQHGCTKLLAESSGIVAVLGIFIEKLLIAGGVEGGEHRNGPGNLRKGIHHFVSAGELLRCLSGLNNQRVLTPRQYGASIDFSVLLSQVMTIADEVDPQLRQATECYVEESILDSLPAQILLCT
jgi:hypothetical protein